MTYNLIMGMWLGMSIIMFPMTIWIVESELRDSKWHDIIYIIMILNLLALGIVGLVFGL